MLRLKLARDLVRSLKRGNPWVFADALSHRPSAASGTPAVLLDKGGRQIAKGFYDPNSPIAFRACVLRADQKLDAHWARIQLEKASALRRGILTTDTTGYRLLNGEGDGLPGLICDIYATTAVLQFDGEGPENFWDARAVADWLTSNLSLSCVFKKRGRSDQDAGEVLIGSPPVAPVPFREHGAAFTADVVHGQKTGFFLDQRENRQCVRAWSRGQRVLNMFGYTGGFSVCAGLGGARDVTTVDTAAAALHAASEHWLMNDLDASKHHTVCADAFEFLESARARRETWGLIVLDPPSFAPSQRGVSSALASYQRLVGAGGSVTESGGLLAAASCSSHVRLDDFLQACQEGISDCRRRATVLEIRGQPADHPSPLALPEFRYLKFVIMRLD